MRRARYLLAVLLLGATSVASGQGRAVIVARLDNRTSPPGFAAYVSNLLDDPEWQERWNNAFFIQAHWKVQLWRDRFLGGSLPAVEWDVCVQQVPDLDLFNVNEPGRRGGRATTSYRTLDSLKAHLIGEVGLPPPVLSSGKWFYQIDVHVSTSEQDPCDPRTAAARPGMIQRLIQGDGPSRDLPPRRLSFKVP